MTDKPAWRWLYDTVEHSTARCLEAMVRDDSFSRATALVGSTQRTGSRLLGTDVARLRAQLGSLDREVRRLNLRLEQTDRSRASGGDGPRSGGQ